MSTKGFWSAPLSITWVRRVLGKGAAVAVIVAFTVVTMRIVWPVPTEAQPAQQGEVRASAFVLVGPDGNVLARLAPGPMGNGNLSLFNTEGVLRAAINGAGNAGLFQPDGKVRVTLAAGAAPGLAVWDEAAQASFDAGQTPPPRLFIGQRALSGGSYGMATRDADDNLTLIPPVTPAP
jgi:hypothetical protein